MRRTDIATNWIALVGLASVLAGCAGQAMTEQELAELEQREDNESGSGGLDEIHASAQGLTNGTLTTAKPGFGLIWPLDVAPP